MPGSTAIPADLTKPVAGAMTTLGRTLGSVMEAGRDILARRRSGLPAAAATRGRDDGGSAASCSITAGEASGLALAGEIISGYQRLPPAARLAFSLGLVSEFDVDANAVSAAAERYRARPTSSNCGPESRGGGAATETVPAHQYGA